MNKRVDEYLTAVEGAKSQDELLTLMDSVVKNIGFDGFSYHRYSAVTGDIDYDGQWPTEWLARYDNKHYVDIDPVAERLLQSVTPFTWQEAVAAHPLNAGGHVVMNEARDFGIVDGAEIPIHEAGYGLASFSVFSSDARSFREAWSENRHAFHLLCLHMHEKFRSFNAEPGTEPAPHLTARERECLVLTSRGKTAADIGQILSISDRTAKQHLESATRKLGSYSKHHAVVKAIMTRMILP